MKINAIITLAKDVKMIFACPPVGSSDKYKRRESESLSFTNEFKNGSIMKFLKRLAGWTKRKKLPIAMDNCCGQNKNNCVIRLAPNLV